MASILVVENDAHVQGWVCLILRSAGHDVHTARSGEPALRVADSVRPDVALVEFNLPGLNGIETYKMLAHRHPALMGIILTSRASRGLCAVAMRQGLFDYIEKPIQRHQLLSTVARAAESRRRAEQVAPWPPPAEVSAAFEGLIGASAVMREIFRLIVKIAANNEAVLLVGETGTGKELVARAIHACSSRSRGPFIDVNCPAVPPALFEDEFFGHDRGAFTEARDARLGRFERAHHGTLFLDGICELSHDNQAKLLRVIERREVTRLGGTRALSVDARIIAATNRPLSDLIVSERLRRDLFYRLNVFTCRIPTLRERGPGDLELLIDHFFARIAREVGSGATFLSTEARRVLMSYHWPGNVRELENAIRHALLMATGSTIEAADLPTRVRVAAQVLENLAEPLAALPAPQPAVIEPAQAAAEVPWIETAVDAAGFDTVANAPTLKINRR